MAQYWQIKVKFLLFFIYLQLKMTQLSEDEEFPSHKQIMGDFHGGGMCAPRTATMKPRLINYWSHLSSDILSLMEGQRSLCRVSSEARSLSLCKINLTCQGEMVFFCLLHKQLSEKNASALKTISCFEFPQQREIMSVCGHCLICHHTLHTCLEMSYLSTHVYNYCGSEK